MQQLFFIGTSVLWRCFLINAIYVARVFSKRKHKKLYLKEHVIQLRQQVSALHIYLLTKRQAKLVSSGRLPGRVLQSNEWWHCFLHAIYFLQEHWQEDNVKQIRAKAGCPNCNKSNKLQVGKCSSFNLIYFSVRVTLELRIHDWGPLELARGITWEHECNMTVTWHKLTYQQTQGSGVE